jgi:hypothetical protein
MSFGQLSIQGEGKMARSFHKRAETINISIVRAVWSGGKNRAWLGSHLRPDPIFPALALITVQVSPVSFM